MNKLSILILLLSFFSCAHYATADVDNLYREKGKTNAYMSGFDDLVSKDEVVNLKVKLENDGVIPYRTDIPNEEVTFYYRGKQIGAGITDDDGMATLDFKKMEIGEHHFIAKLNNQSEFKAREAHLMFVVVDQESPILISDIDHTISDASGWQVLIRPNRKLPPLPNAQQGIHFFNNNGYQIVYITARDDTFLLKTKEWLGMYKFIKAPVYFWDYRGAGVPQDHGDYKSKVIAGLKDKFHNILIGVGDKPHDIRAYRDHGLRSYYIGEPDETIHPAGIRIQSWDELVKHYTSNPIGALASDPEVI